MDNEEEIESGLSIRSIVTDISHGRVPWWMRLVASFPLQYLYFGLLHCRYNLAGLVSSIPHGKSLASIKFSRLSFGATIPGRIRLIRRSFSS